MKFDPTRDNLFSMRDEVAHTKLRAKMAAGVRFTLMKSSTDTNADLLGYQYSGKENESMEGSIDAIIAQLVELIEKEYLSTGDVHKPMDWGEMSSFFTLDVISELAFGKPFGYLEHNRDPFNYLEMIKTFVPIMMIQADVYWLSSFLQSRLLRGFLPKESDKLGFGAFIGYIISTSFSKTMIC